MAARRDVPGSCGHNSHSAKAGEEVLVGLAHRKAPIHLLCGPNSKENHEG